MPYPLSDAGTSPAVSSRPRRGDAPPVVIERRMRRRDWAHVRAALHDIFPRDLPLSALDARLWDEWPYCHLATHNGAVVGVAWLFPTRTEGHGWLDFFGVLAAYQGLGIGRRLLASAMTGARQQGLEHVGLSVRHEDTAAIRLYGSCGFAVAREDARALTMYRGERPAPEVRRRVTRHLGWRVIDRALYPLALRLR